MAATNIRHLNEYEQFLVIKLCHGLGDAVLILQIACRELSHAEFLRLTLPLFSAVEFIAPEVRALQITCHSAYTKHRDDGETLAAAVAYLEEAVSLVSPLFDSARS